MSLKTKYFGGWLKPENMQYLSTWSSWQKTIEERQEKGEIAMVFYVPKNKENQVAVLVEKYLQENEKK